MVKVFVHICVFVLCCSIFTTATAKDMSYTDAHIKAAYLLKLPNFITWPEGELTTPTTICFVGNGFVGHAMAYLLSEKPGSSEVKVVKKSRTSSYAACHIVFFGYGSEIFFTEVLHSVENKPILTVGEIDHFAVRNGIIGFVHEEGVVKLVINKSKIRGTGLYLSSKLLDIAQRIIE